MTHPAQLHATTALWSLTAALRHLATRADAEARDIAAELAEQPDGLPTRSSLSGGTAPGGHGDPVATAYLLGARAARTNRWATMHAGALGTMAWLADMLRAYGPAPDPLERLRAAVPDLPPAACTTLTRWVQADDTRIRTTLGLGPDQWPLTGVACPACDVRLLHTHTSPPDTALWTVTCTAGCTCTGDDCPCGMPVRVAGEQHIWAADTPLIQHATATLTGQAAA